MKTVVGFFWRDEDVKSSINRLKEAGFAQDGVAVLTRTSRKRLVSDQAHPVARSAGWGAVVGVVIYAVFGLGAALAGCTYCGFDFAYAVGTLVGCVVVGGFVGVLLGQWIGLSPGWSSCTILPNSGRADSIGAPRGGWEADGLHLTNDRVAGLAEGDTVAVG
jgi:hypothetical protein